MSCPVRELCAEAFALRFSDPAAMLRLCEMGIEAAEIRGEAQAHAHAHLGNARRILGDFEGARAALTFAESLETGEDRPLRLRFLASLEESLRNWPAALLALAESARLLPAGEDLAAVMVKTAAALIYSGQPRDGATVAFEAVPMIRDNEDLLRSALSTLSVGLMDAGEPDNALSVMLSASALMERGGRWFRVKRTWIHGQIANALTPGLGIELLRRSRQEYLEAGMAYEVALISLELAQVHLGLGDRRSARINALVAAQPLRVLGVERELVGALLLAVHSDEAEQAQLLADSVISAAKARPAISRD